MVLKGRKMVFISAAILFSLSIVVQGQRKVTQDKISVTKSKDKTVYIPCRASGLGQTEYVHWYQKKEGEPFKRVLYIHYEKKTVTYDSAHPQRSDFSAREFDLVIHATKVEHSATYYCACWDAHSHT